MPSACLQSLTQGLLPKLGEINFGRKECVLAKSDQRVQGSGPSATPHHTQTLFPERHGQLDHNHTHRSQDREDRDIKRWIGMEGKALAKWTTFTRVVGKMAVR